MLLLLLVGVIWMQPVRKDEENLPNKPSHPHPLSAIRAGGCCLRANNENKAGHITFYCCSFTDQKYPVLLHCCNSFNLKSDSDKKSTFFQSKSSLQVLFPRVCHQSSCTTVTSCLCSAPPHLCAPMFRYFLPRPCVSQMRLDCVTLIISS